MSPFFHPNIGGVETHLQDLVDYLQKQGRPVYVLTYMFFPRKSYAKIFKKSKNLEIYRIPWPGFDLFNKLEKYPLFEFLYLSPALFIASFLFLAFNFRRVKVIHAHGLNAAVVGLLASSFYRKKLVVSIHAIYEKPPSSLFSKLTKIVLKSAAAVLTLSAASKRELLKIGLADQKIKVFTYWVDQEIFKVQDKAAAKEKLGWSNKFVVLFVGRFIEKKGADILLEVASDIREINGVYIALIGSGPLAPSLEGRASLSANTIYIGKIDNVDLPLYYNAADILCVPSKYEEGFGRVILEGMSCGLPVIASRRGGMPEIINEEVGILVEPTAKEFGDAIITLYKDESMRKELGRKAGIYAWERFSERNVATIVNSYGV